MDDVAGLPEPALGRALAEQLNVSLWKAGLG